MQIRKTKTYDNISIQDIKDDLAIVSDDIRYDSQIRRFMKAALDEAEALIQDDIVLTTTTLVMSSLQPFCFSEYELPSGNNVAVSAITYSLTGEESTVLTGSSFFVEPYQNCTLVKLEQSINANNLTIVYTSGFAEIPNNVQRAISIKVAEFLDVDRNGYVVNNLTASKAFERLLAPHKTLY